MIKKVLIVLIILFLLLWAALFYRNWRVETSTFNKNNFLNGTFPSPLPDGFYKGSIQALDTPWQGKIFNSSVLAGINKMKGKEVFPFKTYKAKSLTANIEVLRLDYNLPQNPFWAGLIVDELVQHTPSNFTGKVYLNVIPAFPFSLGFFKLER